MSHAEACGDQEGGLGLELETVEELGGAAEGLTRVGEEEGPRGGEG